MTNTQQPGPATAGPVTGARSLRRSASDRIVAGVAGGMAQYTGADPLLVRVGFVVGSLLLGGVGGPLLYLLAWLVVPEDGRSTSIASEKLGTPPWQQR
jgi:phage shock protein PspC (stress-responsive transcriptional regulator)